MGAAPKLPLYRGLCLRCRPLARGQAPCTCGLTDGFGCIANLQDFVVAGGDCRPHTPLSTSQGLSLQTARYPEQQNAWQVGKSPHTTTFRCARLVLQGQRSTLQAGTAAPIPLLSASLGLSCRRLATASNEAFSRWDCSPHTPAFRCARLVLQTARYRGQRRATKHSTCLADGSLPRATNATMTFASVFFVSVHELNGS